jgi:hypothetical protein
VTVAILALGSLRRHNANWIVPALVEPTKAANTQCCCKNACNSDSGHMCHGFLGQNNTDKTVSIYVESPGDAVLALGSLGNKILIGLFLFLLSQQKNLQIVVKMPANVTVAILALDPWGDPTQIGLFLLKLSHPWKPS